uniref:Uncharacterized protein n=1 Tax=Oryza brachyantha TaxID=4533 RepID=J3LIC7_ORYBR
MKMMKNSFYCATTWESSFRVKSSELFFWLPAFSASGLLLCYAHFCVLPCY